MPRQKLPLIDRPITRQATSLSIAGGKKKGTIFHQEETSNSFVGAIDIGTIYSGYAYCRRREGKSVAQHIVMNPPWQTADLKQTTLRTPSCLLLNEKKEFEAYGYDAERIYLERMKKGEQNRVFFYKKFKTKICAEKDLRLNSLITDENGRTVPAIKVFSMAIRYMKSQLLNDICIHGEDVEADDILWVLTVPAMWPEIAKQFMRKAAEMAGIPGSMLKLCLEPEAASIYCQSIPSNILGEKLPIFKSGAKYVLADLGGGITDIVVHEKRKDGLREISRGMGAKIGSASVDTVFVQFLHKLFGDKIVNEFINRYRREFLLMLRDFEEQKKHITPRLTCTTEIKVPPCLQVLCQKEQYNDNLANVVFRSVYKGRVKMLTSKMKIDAVISNEFFRAVSAEMAKLINHALTYVNTAKDVDVLIITGACAESQVVQEFLRNELIGKTQIKKVFAPPDVDVAVLKGAVIFGNNPESIACRVNRFTSGLRIARLFNPEMHKPEKRSFLQGVEYVFDIFSPFLTVGTRVPVGFISHQALTTTEPNQKKIQIDVYQSSMLGHNFISDEGCERLGKVDFEIPSPSPEARTVYVDFSLGDTEMFLYVVDKKTMFKTKYYFPLVPEK